MTLHKNLHAQINAVTSALLSAAITPTTAAIQKALAGRSEKMSKAINTNSLTNILRNHGFISEGKTDSSQQLGIHAIHPMPTVVSDLLTRLSHSAQSTIPLPPVGQFFDKQQWNNIVEEFAPDEKNTHGEGLLTKSFTNTAGTRSYKIYIPSSYQGQPLPLMVMLHGCTQNADDFARGTRMNSVAEEKQCFVVYPVQSQSANASKCWNWFHAADQQRDLGEPSIIAGITRQVISDYGLDKKHVYIAGLSAGGAMAVVMGTTYPDLYAAVGVHSGLPYGAARDLPSALTAMKKGGQPTPAYSARPHKANERLKSIPIIVFHGDRDTTVHSSNGEQLMNQNGGAQDLSRNNMSSNVIVETGKVPQGHSYTRTSHHSENGPSFAEHWVIHGAGHAWAGGSKKGSYTDPKGPDASTEMLRFFYTQSGAK